MVNSFDGDYFGFQAYFEGLPVSYIPSWQTSDLHPDSLLLTRDLTVERI